MWVSITIIAIYISFVLDLLIWPIPSEASTVSLISSKKKIFSLKSMQSLAGLVLSLTFYLIPLYLSIASLLFLEIDRPAFYIVIIGLSISITGRFISLKGTQTLRQNHNKIVVESSIFKRSRNPITLGMHLTIFGLMMCYNFWILWIGFSIYFLILHFKIKIEEGFLEEKFGKKYLEYKEKTPRYL